MKIDHIALWVRDLEKMKDFYLNYFGAVCGEKYLNQSKGFSSYFLSFESGARLELMHCDLIRESGRSPDEQYFGIAHFACSLESREAVDSMTRRLKNDGVTVISEPRITGDGYYESCILDPEMNRVELVLQR